MAAHPFTLFKLFLVLFVTAFLCQNVSAQNITFNNPDDGDSFTSGTSFTASSSTHNTPNNYKLSTITFVLDGTSHNASVSGSTGTYTVNTTGLSVGSHTLATFGTFTRSNNPNKVTSTVTITIYVLPKAPTASNPAAICSGSTATLTASGGSPAGGTYNWYDAATGGNLLQSSTSGTFVTPALTATTDYYVSYTDAASGLMGSPTDVTVTVSTPPSSAFTVSPSTMVNEGDVVTLTYSGTDSPVWNFGSATIVTGSGNTGKTYQVKWPATGSYNITLTATKTSTGCVSSTTTPISVAGAPTETYGFSKALILRTSNVKDPSGHKISTTLTNFPALVYIQDDALKILNQCGDKVQYPLGNGGGLTAATNYDFAFTLPGSNTELPYQVDTYDSVNGILFAWVQIPSATSTDVPITFYFGSLSPAHSAAFSAKTWASDYLAVYHFNEASTSAPVLDATSNTRNAVQANTSVTNDEIHIAANVPIPGGGYSFNGSSTSIIQNTGTNPDITDKFTLSAWVYYNGDANSDNKIISNEINYTQGYKLSVKYGKLETETRFVGGRPLGNLGTGGAVSSKTWHYIQGVFTGGTSSGSTFINYIDGEAVASSDMVIQRERDDITPDAGDVAQMGIDYLKKTSDPNDASRATNWYNGYMDEVRISNAVKTPDWIRCEYYNQTQPKVFTDYSAAIVTYTAKASGLTGALVYTWNGTSTNETLAGSWDIGQTPAFNGNTKMVIPKVNSNVYPKLTADEGVYALTIAAGASINLNGHTLSVGCNIYNSATTGGTGILNGGNGASGGITWNGKLSTQTYYGYNNIANTGEINNMTVNNSTGGTIMITKGPIDVYAQLTITKGNLVIDNSSNGAMTLKSLPALTAGVAAIPAAYSISGNVGVERYVSGGSNAYRGYRLFSSPIYTAKSGSNTYYDFSYLQYYTPTTGSLGPSGGMTKAGNPTIYLYRDNVAFTNSTFNTGNFRGVNKINNTPLYTVGVDYDSGTFNMQPGTGFMFWYRGDLTNLTNKFTTTTLAEATTLMSKGVLNQQSVTVVNWYTGQPVLQCTPPSVTGNPSDYYGYNLVGNPYASSIDWNTFSSTDPTAGIYGKNVGPTIYEFNVLKKDYATYSNGISVNTGSNIVASGQGFFVQAKTANATLTFNENAKSSAQPAGPTTVTAPPSGSNLLLSTKPIVQQQLQYIRLEMAADTLNKEEAVVRFDNSAKDEYSIDEDAQYFVGSGSVDLSTRSADSVSLAINDIAFPKLKSKVVKMTANATTDGLYTLSMTEIKSIPDIYEIWLMDAYKKDSLDIKHNPTYKFNIAKSDASSFGANRFTLVIRQDPALGLHLLDFAAAKTTTGAEITWKTENEENYTNFTVERSTDNGQTFNVLGGFLSSDQGTYSLPDKNPAITGDMYRLKLEDLNGTITYSKVVTLMYTGLGNSKISNSVFVYPNPAVSTINLTINQGSVDASKSSNPSYNIKITNSTGKILKTVNSSQDTWQDNVSNLMPGAYVIDVINNNDKSVVGKAKFVKL